jgi:predicted metal-binding membrane protein
MNEKPGLEPGFFCSTSCWRLDGLRVAPGAEDMLWLFHPLRASLITKKLWERNRGR